MNKLMKQRTHLFQNERIDEFTNSKIYLEMKIKLEENKSSENKRNLRTHFHQLFNFQLELKFHKKCAKC